LAGTKRGEECTLILTEGDSAKSLAIAGLSVVGRDRYGVFPLNGKLLNVREASHKAIMANAEIQAAVPEVAPQTTQIAAGVDRLHAVEAQLRQMRDSLAAEAKLASGMAKDLAAANARIAQLEEKANGLLNTILIGASVAGLALAVVSGIWLRSWQGVVTGLGIFAACAAGMWIIQYRAYVAIGGLLIAGAYAAWCIIAERRASTQIVATVEAIKGATPDFKSIANSIQTSKLTRRIVDKIKGTRKP
jgi:hypothetical protein